MRWSNLSNSLATAFIIALVVIVSTAYLSLNNLRMLKSSHNSSLRTASIVDQLDRLLYAVKDAETNSRAYLISGKLQFLESFEKSIEDINGYRNALKLTLSDHEELQKRMTTLDSLISEKTNGMQKRVSVMRTAGFKEAQKLFLNSNSFPVMQEITTLMREEEQSQRQLQREDDKKLEVQFADDFAINSVLAGIATLVVTLFFIIANRQVSRRTQSEKALQVSEDRYHTFIENSLDGIFVSDLGGSILYVNPAGRNLLGRPEEQLVGTDTLKYIHPDDVQALRNSLTDLVSGRVQSIKIEARINPKEKPARWVEATANKTKFGHNMDVIIADYRDVTDRKAAEQAHFESELRYREASERLQGLSRRLLEIQETERHQLAVELHDEMGQSLTAIQMNLQSIQKFKEAGMNSTHLEESTKLIGQLLEQVRNLSLELRPLVLDHLGLVPALRWYIDRHAQRGTLSAEFKPNLAQERFAPEIETTCFRIVQEALTNVARHSHANHVKVELSKVAGDLVLTISDDGVGIDSQEMSHKMKGGMNFGIMGMRERVSHLDGTFDIHSNKGAGTQIIIHIPLMNNSNINE